MTLTSAGNVINAHYIRDFAFLTIQGSGQQIFYSKYSASVIFFLRSCCRILAQSLRNSSQIVGLNHMFSNSLESRGARTNSRKAVSS